MAAFQTSCGQESCLCSCLFWDLELAKAWLNTARQYWELAKQPVKGVVLRQLIQPWKLTTLQEHETCFQQWNVLQLWMGIISTIVIFVMNFIWYLAEDNELAKPPLGTIIMNAIIGFLLTAFFTHLAWYGVVKKHGCCCFFLCCCLGKPNLLVVAIICGLFGVLAIVAVVQSLGSVQGAIIAAVLVGAFFALMHGVTLLYVAFEALMIWKFSTSDSTSTKDTQKAVETKKDSEKPAVVGAAEVAHDAAAENLEAGECKTEV